MHAQVEYVKGWGKFVGPNEVEVALLDGGSSTISTKNTIIATGSEVAPLPGIQIDEERCAVGQACKNLCGVLAKQAAVSVARCGYQHQGPIMKEGLCTGLLACLGCI
jgi:dihydrolipoamide dehydrogenase